MNNNRILTLLFILLLSFPIAAETVTITLEEAVKQALDNSLNLKKSSIDLAQTEYSANRLWAEIFPGFSLRAGLDFLPRTPLFTNPGFSYKSDALSYSLSFGISLSLNPSLRSSMKNIELAYRTQLLRYEEASNQLEIQVIKSFLDLKTKKENIVNMEENLRVAEQQLEKNLIARANGLLNELDLLNSRLSVETARYELSDTRNTYQNTLEEFLAVLGLETGTNIIFNGSIEIVPVSYDPEQLIQDYLPRRPDIIMQRQIIERLENSKNITTLNSRSPRLDISTTWNGGSASGQGLGGKFTDNVSGSLTLTIPIDSWIPGTRQNQTIRAANAEIEKARLDLQDTEILAKNKIRSLISNLQNIRESLEIAGLRLEIAGRTVEAADTGFRSGTVEFQELEKARKDLADARQRLLQGEYNYQSLLLDLAAAINVDWKTLTRGLP